MSHYDEFCHCTVIHQQSVDQTRKKLLSRELAGKLSDFYKIMADPTRVLILQCLQMNEMCVCDIAAVIGMQQSAVSHQLRLLKQARLVKNRKEGKIVYYSLEDQHIDLVFSYGIEHIKE